MVICKMSNKVAVFGMGYVGCVTAACLSRDGNQVVGVDVNAKKVASIQSGIPPVLEPGLGELLSKATKDGNLNATTSAAEAVASSNVALIAVGTPSAIDGDVSSGAVEHCVRTIARELVSHNRKAYTIVVRSTLLPGILEERLAPILANELGSDWNEEVGLCNNPEFLRETTAIRDYDAPPFVLVGASDETSANAVLAFYDHIEAEKIVTDTRTAAMVKYASNAYHAAKICFANEIGTLARSMKADGVKVMDIVCRDTQLNVSRAYLRPGFAFGGSCLPKDVRALARLAQREGIDVPLLPAVLSSNARHIERGIVEIYQHGSKKVGLIGLGFKAGTDDLRESPLVEVAETLLGKGYDLKIYDPHIAVSELVGQNLTFVEAHLPHLASLLCSAEDVLSHADTLVLGSDVAKEFQMAGFAGALVDLRSDLVACRSIDLSQ